MRDTIKAIIEGNGPLIAILTGGVFTGPEISRELAPGAFDANGEIQPCALVKLETENAVGPDEFSGQQFVAVYLYERAGSTALDAALDLLRPLLHRQKIGTTAKAVFEARWFNDVRDVIDGALNCSLALSRYEITRYRG